MSGKEYRGSDPTMGTAIAFLLTMTWVVAALGSEMTWPRILHWSGEALLVMGILLAAVGTADVRREWTEKSGFAGTVRAAANRVAGWLRGRWNWLASTRLGRLLRLPQRARAVISGNLALTLPAVEVRAAADVIRVNRSGLSIGERVGELEKQMSDVLGQLNEMEAKGGREALDRQAAADRERADRMAEDQRTRESIANLAGGGLRLQAWGVVFLIAGTVLTAFF